MCPKVLDGCLKAEGEVIIISRANRLRFFGSALLGLFLSCLVHAGEDWQKFPIGPFSGLNDRDNSYTIPSQNAQALLNVEITPGGKSVKKRHGYGTAWTMTTTTSPMHGVYDFFDSNGNEVNLFFNDNKITASVGGAAQTVLLSTAPNGATWQCTDTLGQAYCVNTSRTGLYKISGSTLSQIMSVVSTGTMIATAVDRLVMAGFSDAPARIDFSAASDFTTWGTGSLGSSPVQVTISAPGAKVTHINYTFGRVMWFKDTSFGFIIVGNQPLQPDWVNKTVAFDVGTNDNSYVYREGILYFRGKDSHIYQFDGNTYQRLSREIAGTINQAQTRGTGSWVQSSAADFSNGYSTGTVVDTATISGQLQLSLSTANDSCSGAGLTCTGISGVTGALSDPCGSADQCVSGGNYQASSFTVPAPMFLRQVAINVSANNTGDHSTSLLKIRSSNGGSVPGNLMESAAFPSGNLNPAHVVTFTFSGTTILLPNTTYWIQVDQSASGCTDGINSIIWYGDSGQVDSSYCGNSLVKGIRSDFTIYGSTYLPSGTWQSAVKNAPNLTSWDSFAATIVNNDGTHTFSIRSSTGVFYSSATSPAWTSLASGNIPTVTPNAYFQIKDYLTTSISTTTPILKDFTQNWFEGNASDKSYATYFDDKIIFSAAIGTGTSTNNKDLIYDLLNQTWLVWDLPSNGFYVKANKLYFGSSNGGYVYKYGDVEDDNGSAINSYWESKDFFAGDPFTTQEIPNISIATKSVNNSSMTVTYELNGSSVSSFVIPLTNSNLFINKNKNLPIGTIGNTFSIQFGNNAADQPWEVFAVQVGIREKSWVPN